MSDLGEEDDDLNDETFSATFHTMDSAQLSAETERMASLAEQHEAFLKAHGLRGSPRGDAGPSEDEFDIDLQMSSVLKALEIDEEDSGLPSIRPNRPMMTVADLEARLKPKNVEPQHLSISQQPQVSPPQQVSHFQQPIPQLANFPNIPQHSSHNVFQNIPQLQNVPQQQPQQMHYDPFSQQRPQNQPVFQKEFRQHPQVSNFPPNFQHNFHLRQHEPQQQQQFPQQRPLHILRPDVRIPHQPVAPNLPHQQNLQQPQFPQSQSQQSLPNSVELQSQSSYVPSDSPHTHIPLPARRFECMQKSEIAQIIRVQLSQLQTGGIESNLPVIFKPKVNPFRNPDGSPILQTGTLGRISVPNLQKPKKLLALEGSGEKKEINLDEDPGPPRQLMFGNFSLAFLIEEGHRGAMDLEDCDTVIAQMTAPQRFEDPNQTFQRARLVQERSQLVSQLAEALDLEEGSSSDFLVLKFLQTGKGRYLIYRALLLLPPPYSLQLVFVLLHDIKALLDNPQSTLARDHKIGQLMGATLLEMPMEQLIACFQLLVTRNDSTNMVRILRSSVGAAVFLSIFKQAHAGLTHDLEKIWKVIFVSFLALLQGHFASLLQPQNAEQEVESALASRNTLWEVIAAVVFHAATRRSQLSELVPLVTQGLAEIRPATPALNFLASFFDLVP